MRLLRVADGELLWGDEFDEKFTDMFSVEDSISQKVANALTINLSGEEQRQLLRPFTENNDAYQLYMKGRFFWNKRTVDGVKKSIDYFQQAIAGGSQLCDRVCWSGRLLYARGLLRIYHSASA